MRVVFLMFAAGIRCFPKKNALASLTTSQIALYESLSSRSRLMSTSRLDEQQGAGSNNSVVSSCVPCSSLDKSHILSSDDISKRLPAELPLWKLVEKNSGSDDPSVYMLSRSFTSKNFQCALDSINEMGAIAEREQHHPDFHLINYREVEVDLYTHKLGGITENDIALAKLFDSSVQVEYSPKWLKEHPEAETNGKRT